MLYGKYIQYESIHKTLYLAIGIIYNQHFCFKLNNTVIL